MSEAIRARVGAWDINPTTEIPEGVVSVLKNRIGATIKPLLGLAEQIVAGKNYLLLCNVQLSTLEGNQSLASVVVYADLDGNFKVTNISTLAEKTVGGFDLDFHLGLPEQVATGFGEVFGSVGPLGADYHPVAYLGKQVVHGTNHMVLAKQVLVTYPETTHLVIVVLNDISPEPGAGHFSIVSIEKLV